MARTAAIWCLTLAVLPALAGPSAAGEVSDRLSRTVPFPPGTAMSLVVTIGHVRISAWDREDAAVDIVRRAPAREGLERLSTIVDASGGEVSVRAVQRDDGRDAAVRADVTVRLPAAADVREVSVFEGGIHLMGLRGRTSARIERGDIVAEDLRGRIRLETVIGAIRVARSVLEPDGLIRLRTFNGDVTVALARRPEHARILALSLGGTITSDLPLTHRERTGPRWAEATIGDGEPVLSIDVVNGNIRITAGVP